MKRFLLIPAIAALFISACAPQPTPAPTAVPPTEAPATEVPQPTVAPTEVPPTEVPATEAPAGITFTDALKREVSLPATPQRIVLAGKALFMIADAVYAFPSAGEKIVGYGSTAQGSSNFISLIDPAYDSKQVLEKEPTAEDIAALKPDLVILKSSVAESIGAPIEAVGIPVAYVDLETPAQYAQDIAMLGTIFGDEARATEIINYYQSNIDRIQSTVSSAEKPSTLMLYYSDKDGNVAFNVPPMNWLQTEMVNIAGGAPVWADANPGKGWTEVTMEQVAAWDADKIFVIAYNDTHDELLTNLQADANWQSVRAMKEGNLYVFPKDFYSWDQPDVRWYMGLSWVASKLHPDLFPEYDINAVAQDFYGTLYGLDAAFVEENVTPLLTDDMH